MNYTEAIKSTPIVVVEFYASWCPHCQRMAPGVTKIKKQLEGKVDIYQFDIDENPELSDKQGVETVPTIIIYKNGKEQWREAGEMEGKDLLEKIDSYL